MSRSVNYWPDSKCAKAFWNQHELPPYRELLADTTAWLRPRPGERWLDLGCGSGQLSVALWRASAGTLAEVAGIDCAAINAERYDRLRELLEPRPTAAGFHFVTGDFSQALPWDDGRFDGVVSGLAIQYAESWCEQSGCWTDAGYDRVLSEVHRVLAPGGRFIFSVNIPEPAWGRVAWRSLAGMFRARRPLHYLKRAWRIWSYGGWLKREARRGRFHYLPSGAILDKLITAGFAGIEHCLSFAGQAYLFRCVRPVDSCCE
jgi:SAM-dependent methyltransferase